MRLDICARGFWNNSKDAFFDVQFFFYPNAPIPLIPTEDMNRPRRDNTFKESETNGKEATTFYKRLADMIA